MLCFCGLRQEERRGKIKKIGTTAVLLHFSNFFGAAAKKKPRGKEEPPTNQSEKRSGET